MTVNIDTAALDALFAPYDRTDAPGFAVGIALRGKPVYRRGFGMANVELPVALSPTIRMRIGSTSKHFCVLAMMLLAEQGQLSIEDSPRRYIPELPAWAEPMTLRQLAAHTSGMRDSLDLLMLSAGPGAFAAVDFQLGMLTDIDSVNFAPGASWNYNNGGYVLLSEVVERVSGQRFGDFLRERILEPVGMHDTVLRPVDTDLLPNSATLHVPRADGGWIRGIFGASLRGEGGIVSTVDDMLLWLKHMSAPVVGSAQTWAEMRTVHATHGYGLGLNMTKHRGLDTVHHAGGVIGGSSQMLKVLDHELDIILMTNGRSGLDLYTVVDAIIDLCIPGLPPVPGNAQGDVVSGTFYSAATGQLISMVEANGSQAVSIGGMVLPAHRELDGSLSVAILPTDLRIRPVAEGGRVHLETIEFGQADFLDEVGVPDGLAFDPLVGRYESAAAGLAATIHKDAEGKARLLVSSAAGATDYFLDPRGPDLWQASVPTMSPPGCWLEFDEYGFLLSTGRTMRLRFRRST